MMKMDKPQNLQRRFIFRPPADAVKIQIQVKGHKGTSLFVYFNRSSAFCKPFRRVCGKNAQTFVPSHDSIMLCS
jgi:hypothetical protein